MTPNRPRDRDKGVRITDEMISRVVKEPRHMAPYFPHEPLNPTLYAGEMAMPIVPVPKINSAPYDIEAKQSNENEDSDTESESEITAKETSSIQDSPSDTRIVIGPRPVEGKGRKLCGVEEMDEDDKLLYFLKLAKWSDRDIQNKFVSEGRINYNLKTISTRFFRMRQFIMAENDKRLKDGTAVWLQAEENLLPEAVAFAEKEIEKERLALPKRKWKLVSEYIQKHEPLATYSGEACREHYNAIGMGKEGAGTNKRQKILGSKVEKLKFDRQQQVAMIEHFKTAARPEA